MLFIVALGAYFWANATMNSLMNYRSPLAQNPPVTEQQMNSEALTRRVVIVLIDALRNDTSLDSDVMPYLNKLRQSAAVATMHSQAPSYSAPGWATILTGAWPDINDSQSANPPDDDTVRSYTQDDIFAAANRAGYKTAVSGFTWFKQMLANSGVDDGFYTTGEDSSADVDVLYASIPWLEDENHKLVLIHLDQVDYAGHHEGGPRGEEWKSAAHRVDNLLQTIAAHLDFEKDTLLIISDHGQIDQGGHGGDDPITLVEPFVLIGAGVVPGQYGDVEMVDVAPTVAELLGMQIPASNEGRGLTEMLALSEDQKITFQTEWEAQQSRLLQDYQIAVKANGFSVDESGSAASAIQAIRTQKLNQERVIRLVITVMLAAVPVYFLVRSHDRKIWKFMLGAIVSLIIFHGFYALVEGKTYSLSSVTGSMDLITGIARFMGVGFLIAWIISMLWSKSFNEDAHSVAQASLGFTFITLYIVALPILWNFYRNGALITWTLPEFSSMFIGFQAILQSLAVAVFGLVLTGLSALSVFIVSKRKK